jgi:hypothetical protein
MNKVIGNSEDRIERMERCDVEIDVLRNRVDQGGNNVRKGGRHVSPVGMRINSC